MRTHVICLAVVFGILCPYSSAQWVQTNGPFHGNVRSLLVRDTTLFAGTGWDGVFLSMNSGRNWTEANGSAARDTVPNTTPNTRQPNTSVEALAFSGTNLFAGTLDAGVFLSSNDGTSWKAVNTGLTSLHVYALAVSGSDLFAGTSGGVFLSTDDGTSWTATGLTSTAVAASAVSGSNLFAGTKMDGIFLSTNNGTSWTAVNEGMPRDIHYGTQYPPIHCLASTGRNLFAGTLEYGVFHSTNSGTNWTAVNDGLPKATWDSTQYPAIYCFGTCGQNLFAGTYFGVFLSANNGTSWKAVNTGLTSVHVYALAVSGTNLFAGTSGGVFHSTNSGKTWTQVNTGLTNMDVSALAVSGTNLFAGTLDGSIFLSPDNGTKWTEVNAISPRDTTPNPPLHPGLANTSVSALAASGANLFAGTLHAGVFLSTNDGTGWAPVNNGLPEMDYFYDVVNALAVMGANLFAGTNSAGVFRSASSGTSWIAVNEGLPKSTPYYPPGQYAPIRCFASSGQNLFVGADGGVFLSTNNGTNWTPAGLPDEAVYALAFNGTNLFAGTWGGGVFLSTNNGTSWTEVNSGLPPYTFARCLLVSGSNLFAGTGFLNVSMPGVVPDTLLGVYLSTNNGTSWSSVNSGLPHHIDVYALAASGTSLYAGTGDGCVWRRPLSDMITSVGTATSELPREFRLLQNYPNPFNPSTIIKYELPKSSEVRLSVFDVLGHEVSVLVNERRNAGVYEVKCDASGLASGVYFYRLHAGDFVSTKRMLVLK